MSGILKRKVLIWSVISSLFTLLFSCSEDRSESSIEGNTQGTTYQVKIIGGQSVSKRELDSILADFDQSLSTYIDTSVISRINACADSITIVDMHGYFRRCYELSQTIYHNTDGAFDPSVFPLVAGWGFMKDMETPLDKASVDSLMTFVGFEPGKHHSVVFSGDSILFRKYTPGFKLDFNAIAQGLSVDVISEYLQGKGIKDYYVEIGGEVYVHGKNSSGKKWSIGIDMPKAENESHEIENIVYLTDHAIATSGNYRKFYIKNGVKYAHTLDPKTGYPVDHSLLSATVIASDCATADAYATAFMVVGKLKAMQMLKGSKGIEGYLLADDAGSIVRSQSTGFTAYLRQ